MAKENQMPVETPVSSLVRQLSQAGIRPDERLARHILDGGDAARAALITLATNIPALHEEVPACLGPLHALRLLGELPDLSIIEPLLACLPIPVIDHETDIAASMYASEVLQIIGRVGAPAVAALWALADDESKPDQVRGAAINALVYVATYAPDVRDEVLAEARGRLVREDLSSVVISGTVTLLAELGDAPSYKDVMAAYRAGRADQRRMPAAVARQQILGGGIQSRTCVNHSLWERYDAHGPTFKGDE
jgi:hypothetical protein